MFDSWGDGWNGNVLNIGGLEYSITDYAAEGTGELCLPIVLTEGCMDPMATNYDADANTDDGSCEYDCEVMLDTSLY